MHLLALSISHATAPLALREQATFPPAALGEALGELRGRLEPRIAEAAILSTCNRTELYCSVTDPQPTAGALGEWLAQSRLLPPGALAAHLLDLHGSEAVRHAFRVACGLESMVLGEPQILGQMKDAARRAQEAGALGPLLHQLFQRSFAVGKEVRTRTGIGAASVSLAAATVRLARRMFPDLRETGVVLVGAGSMSERIAAHFAGQKPRTMAVANRTAERAERLARRFAARAVPLAALEEEIGRADIVVSCTSSGVPVLRHAAVQKARRGPAHRPLLIVDLAVPRDVEPEIARLPNVTLYTIDHLRELVHSGASSRRAALAQAEALLGEEVHAFMAWMDGRRAAPLLRRLDEDACRLRTAEVAHAQRLLARGRPADSVLAELARRLSNKLLHAPRSMLARGALAPEQAKQLVGHWAGYPRGTR